MSVGASTVRQDEFLIEITTPSKTDNVPIKQSRAEGLCNTRDSTSCWVSGALAAATMSRGAPHQLRQIHSSRMQHRSSKNSRDGPGSTHDTREGSSQKHIHATNIKDTPSPVSRSPFTSPPYPSTAPPPSPPPPPPLPPPPTSTPARLARLS